MAMIDLFIEKLKGKYKLFECIKLVKKILNIIQ